METPFLGEIKIVTVEYAPKGWALCNGQLLPINQNQPLFSLLGTDFGGNGQTTFGLPDLRGRVAMGVGNSHNLRGEMGGATQHTLSLNELPQHILVSTASSSTGTSPVPGGNLLARMAPANPYAAPASLVQLNAATVASTGGAQPHENMQPYLTLTFVIALTGIFPSQN
ncbi:MAG TPA: tail fiber protein [Allosphingosinicella sp.]|jgi:microcystin-dependent protein